MPSTVTSIAQVPYSFNGAMVYTSGSMARMYDAPKNTFLPRAGIAIRLNDRTSFRAGYARYAVPMVAIHPETGGLPTNGFSQSTSVLGPLQGMPRALLSDPFPSSNPVLPPAGNSLGRYTDLGNSVSWWNQNMRTPLNDRFNFTVQREMPQRILTEATFFMMFAHDVQGNSMWGGNTGFNLNQMDPNLVYQYKGLVDQTVANPFYGLPASMMPGTLRTQPTVAVSQLLKTYPQYGDLNLNGWPGRSDHYYSFQFKAERPMANGLNLLVAYNYNQERLGQFFNDQDYYANRFTMLDAMHPRHNIRIAGTWELPFGKGRKFLTNANRIVDGILGGWATSQSLDVWQRRPAAIRSGNYVRRSDPECPGRFVFQPVGLPGRSGLHAADQSVVLRWPTRTFVLAAGFDPGEVLQAH